MKQEREAPDTQIETEADPLDALLGAVAAPASQSLLESKESGPTLPKRIDGVVVGAIAELKDGQAWVTVVPGTEPVIARSMVPISAEDVGRAAALMFEAGDPKRPLVMGLVQDLSGNAAGPASASSGRIVGVESDGERLTLSASKEITLKCGAASITLTRAGKVLIRGAYVLTRSTGTNRIQGGSVQIN